MADDNYEDKTEEPTQHRRDELKKQGDVMQSREVVAAVLLLATTGAIFASTRFSMGGVWGLFQESFAELPNLGTSTWTPGTAMSIALFAMKAFVVIVAPVAVAGFVAAIVSSVAQTGFVWTTKPLEIDLDKLNPQRGLGRMFSMDGVFEMGKATVKFIVVAAVVYPLLMKWTRDSGGLFGAEAPALAVSIGRRLMNVLLVTGLAMFIMAAVDYGFQRFRYERRIRMTKEEIREERKQVEGNPQIRARIRGLQRKNSQRRMIDEVRKADVVITNPTHFAIALVYDRETMLAPKIVAKGTDHMAQQIKKIAREAGIPCVENPPLARAMYKALKIGQFISRDLYNAVAEVLAYVYRLKGKTL
ncbi:MAG: flagellar biosynthesis protein FlhB [Bdellovibrionales bacterium]|nr:flagellar biosynthesis protein FlhB [Bdellovibrionales bacterium]